MSVIGTIQSAAETLLPQNYLSFPLKSLFIILQKTHRVWRLFQKKEIYTESNNFAALISGHLVSWTIGNKQSIKVAAQSILIIHRILDVSHKIIQTTNSAKDLRNAFLDFPSLYEDSWEKDQKWKSFFFQETIEKVRFVVLRLWHLIKSFFELTMSVMEAYQAFYLNPNTEQENVREMFVNTFNSIDYLSAHQKLLESQLIKYKPILQQVFGSLGSKDQVDQMINLVQIGFKTITIIKSSNDKVNSRLKDFIHHAAFGFLDSLGLGKEVSYIAPLPLIRKTVPYLIDFNKPLS